MIQQPKVPLSISERAEYVREVYGLKHEMVAKLVRGLVDARYWANEWLNWDPHPGQLFWMSHRAKRAILCTGARYGKSEGEAVRRLRRMFYRPGTRHCNTSITMDQARIVYDKAVSIGEASEKFSVFFKRKVESPFPSLELTNGAELWVRSTQRNAVYIRGHSFHEMNDDEMAYGKRKNWDEVLSQRVMDYDGSLTGTTTPRGANYVKDLALLYESIMRKQLSLGVPVSRLSYVFRRGPTHENPHIPRTALRRMLSLPPRAYDQEVGGLFVDVEDQLLDGDTVTEITDPDLNPHMSESGEWLGAEQVPDPDGVYVLGVDLARHRAWTVGTLMRCDVKPAYVVGRFRLHRQPFPEQKRIIENMAREWRADLWYDATGMGDSLGEFFEVPSFPYDFGAGGLHTERHTSLAKYNLMTALKVAAETKSIRLQFWPELDFQLRHWTWSGSNDEDDDETKAQTWDDLMSLALVVWGVNNAATGPRTVLTAGTRTTARLMNTGDEGRESTSSALDRF